MPEIPNNKTIDDAEFAAEMRKMQDVQDSARKIVARLTILIGTALDQTGYMRHSRLVFNPFDKKVTNVLAEALKQNKDAAGRTETLKAIQMLLVAALRVLDGLAASRDLNPGSKYGPDDEITI